MVYVLDIVSMISRRHVSDGVNLSDTMGHLEDFFIGNWNHCLEFMLMNIVRLTVFSNLTVSFTKKLVSLQIGYLDGRGFNLYVAR